MCSISSQSAWAIIWLSKPYVPCQGAHDKIFQALSRVLHGEEPEPGYEASWWAQRGRIFAPFHWCTKLRKVSTMSDNVNIMHSLWICRMWCTLLWKLLRSVQFIEWILYTSGTVGTGELVLFMEYGVSEFQGFWLYTNICGSPGKNSNINQSRPSSVSPSLTL